MHLWLFFSSKSSISADVNVHRMHPKTRGVIVMRERGEDTTHQFHGQVKSALYRSVPSATVSSFPLFLNTDLELIRRSGIVDCVYV